MNIEEVMRHLPHRYPFLLVDRVTDWKADTYLSGYKNVTFNEPYFQGHFPIRPVMPGVLITEALAQATGILAFRSMGGEPQDDELYMLVGLDKVSFKRMVEPGDRLDLHVEVKRVVRGLWFFEGVAKVGDEVAAKAVIKCTARAVTE